MAVIPTACFFVAVIFGPISIPIGSGYEIDIYSDGPGHKPGDKLMINTEGAWVGSTNGPVWICKEPAGGKR